MLATKIQNGAVEMPSAVVRWAPNTIDGLVTM
jgi:hypothetical protein